MKRNDLKLSLMRNRSTKSTYGRPNGLNNSPSPVSSQSFNFPNHDNSMWMKCYRTFCGAKATTAVTLGLISYVFVQNYMTNGSDLFKFPSTLSSSSDFVLFGVPENNQPTLVLVPIEPFYACSGKIMKLMCSKTILFEGTTHIPLLPHTSDSVIIDEICMTLIQKHTVKKIIPDEGEYREQLVVEAPVCMQNAATLGVVTKLKSSFGLPEETRSIRQLRVDDISETKMQTADLVDSYNDLSVQTYLAKVRSIPSRTITLKNIDFPSHYRNVYNDWEWETHRDSNFGNLVWRYASTMMLNQVTVNTKVLSGDDWHLRLNESSENKIDALVIATANTLHITDEPQLEELISAMTNRVASRPNVPAIVLGLGIQMEFADTQVSSSQSDMNISAIRLPFDFQKRFLQTVSAHQSKPAIGVRGDLTKGVCDRAGVTHCVSMGCPSMTISRDRNLGKTLHEKWQQVYEKIKTRGSEVKIALAIPAFHADPPGASVYATMQLFAHILERYGSQVTIIKQLWKDSFRMSNYTQSTWLDLYPNSSLKSVQEFQSEEYYNVESWMHGVKSKYDICISARIHGTMMFIGSGVPAIAIPTDFRIMELIDAMKIPHITPESLEDYIHNSQSVDTLLLSLMDNVVYHNFTEFEMNRREKIKGWKNILDTAGLEMDPALLEIIRSPM